jgi:hypothetical protein
MGEKYKVSRELGRNPPPKEEDLTLTEEEIDSILDITPQVSSVTQSGRFYWLNEFVGKAENAAIITSDLFSKIKELEDTTRKIVVGFTFLEDGTVQAILEK